MNRDEQLGVLPMVNYAPPTVSVANLVDGETAYVIVNTISTYSISITKTENADPRYITVGTFEGAISNKVLKLNGYYPIYIS